MRRRDVIMGAVTAGAAALLPAAADSRGPRPYTERYLGRTIRIEAVHGVPRVHIDGRELQLIRMGEGAYLSPLCHYDFDRSPLAAARRAVRQLRGAQLLPFPSPRSWPQPVIPPAPTAPAHPHVRKNYLALTAQERHRFIQAVLETKRSGAYDALVAIHVRANSHDYLHRDHGLRTAHLTPSLLPWHRQFLLYFEQALRAVDPGVTLPYWDWTRDRGHDSPLWADDFMGGDGRPGDREVTTGPFARRNGWRLRVDVRPTGHDVWWANGHYTQDDRDYLTRALRPPSTLSTARQLEDALALPVYDCPPWNHESGDDPPYRSFRNHLEGYAKFAWERDFAKLHGSAHRFVGGHMGYLSSPNDPVFYLHHCFIDKIWADWQHRHPDVPHYLPLEHTRDVPGLHTPLAPWHTMTPADLLDHTRYYRYDRLYPSCGRNRRRVVAPPPSTTAWPPRTPAPTPAVLPCTGLLSGKAGGGAPHRLHGPAGSRTQTMRRQHDCGRTWPRGRVRAGYRRRHGPTRDR
ncbi:tyrosinase family oxidase copper chaperone [Streptomyces albofaciens]|uniref:tyrosinase family oxidase copper chaperone n=1 Tax=Streptomyces albofaciens TaxID=66866 RepID=UPI0031377EBC